ATTSQSSVGQGSREGDEAAPVGALRPPPDPEEPSSGHEAEGVDGARDIVLCHRMRFPAVQGFEGPRGIVAITVPRAGSLTAALSARPPVLSPSWPPG